MLRNLAETFEQSQCRLLGVSFNKMVGLRNVVFEIINKTANIMYVLALKTDDTWL